MDAPIKQLTTSFGDLKNSLEKFKYQFARSKLKEERGFISKSCLNPDIKKTLIDKFARERKTDLVKLLEKYPDVSSEWDKGEFSEDTEVIVKYLDDVVELLKGKENIRLIVGAGDQAEDYKRFAKDASSYDATLLVTNSSFQQKQGYVFGKIKGFKNKIEQTESIVIPLNFNKGNFLTFLRKLPHQFKQIVTDRGVNYYTAWNIQTLTCFYYALNSDGALFLDQNLNFPKYTQTGDHGYWIYHEDNKFCYQHNVDLIADIVGLTKTSTFSFVGCCRVDDTGCKTIGNVYGTLDYTGQYPLKNEVDVPVSNLFIYAKK
jgi:hypothetical protein